jgi:hypothetical protein
MNLKGYYRRIEQELEGIEGDYAVVRSLTTQNGGRSGVLMEVGRQLAARMIVDGLVCLASEEEAERFRKERADESRQIELDLLRSKVQLTVVSESDLASLKEAIQSPRKKG